MTTLSAAVGQNTETCSHCTWAREHELVSMEADTSGQQEEVGDTAEVVTRPQPELRRRSKLRKVVEIIERSPPVITYHMV